jgi:adenylate cyclase
MGEIGMTTVYRFGGFVLDLRRGMLLASDSLECPLRPKAFALLRLLVENAGTVVSHGAIMDAVWPDVIVNDESIAQCIRDIRRTLGSNAEGMIRAVSRRGYMFSAPVSATQEFPLAGMSRQPYRPIVAVLCFAQLGVPLCDPAFCRGLTEEVVTDLSGSRGLLVMPLLTWQRDNASSADMVNLARTAEAGYLLDGSIRCDSARVRVVARLIELTTGTCSWAERYDRTLNGLIPTQEELGCAISWAVEYAVAAAEQKLALRASLDGLSPWGVVSTRPVAPWQKHAGGQ